MDKTTTVGAYTDAALMELVQRAEMLIVTVDDLIEECARSEEALKRILAHKAREAADDLGTFLSNLHELGFIR